MEKRPAKRISSRSHSIPLQLLEVKSHENAKAIALHPKPQFKEVMSNGNAKATREADLFEIAPDSTLLLRGNK